MDCPKCGFALSADALECPRCGIVIAKFLRARERAAGAVPPPVPLDVAGALASESENASDHAARGEWRARAIAVPAALAFAWLAVHASPGAVRLVTMWVHESGHAVTAWICGFLAWPGPWFTPVSDDRSPFFSLLFVGLIGFGGSRAWLLQRWFWVVASAGGILLVFIGTLVLAADSARQLFIFGGDGGSLVLGTALMLTVYSRPNHPIRRNRLRWGLLIIGALALMDAYVVWTGPVDRLPLGENENGLSDPSVLTEEYGWNLLTLIHRYGQLAHACFAVLAIVYVAALLLPTSGARRTYA